MQHSLYNYKYGEIYFYFVCLKHIMEMIAYMNWVMIYKWYFDLPIYQSNIHLLMHVLKSSAALVTLSSTAKKPYWLNPTCLLCQFLSSVEFQNMCMFIHYSKEFWILIRFFYTYLPTIIFIHLITQIFSPFSI